jgi:hypothetical protein
MKSKLEQTTTRNNIRIFGLGEENNENCYDVVLRLCDELNLDVKRNELDRVHGVGRARNMTHSSNNPVHPRPMTVKLTGHQSKLSGSPAKSGPMTLTSENRFPLIFVC